MKKYVLLIAIIFIFILTGCNSQDIPDPEDTLSSFTSNWKQQKFDKMYSILNSKSQQQYSKEEFIRSNEKIYADLKANDIKLTWSELTDKEIKQAKEDKSAAIKLKIQLNTLAGPVEFSKQMDIVLNKPENKDDPAKWEIIWDEGFILPGLDNNGKVLIEREPPKRGEILDRNQMPLALNDVAYNIGVVPNDLSDNPNVLSELSRLLNMSQESIKEEMNASWVQPDYFVPLKVLPASADSALQQLKQLPGVSTRETTGRYYPLGPAAAHLTGYIGKVTQEELKKLPKDKYTDNDLVGKSGLEQMYEEKLHGEEGIKVIVVTESKAGTEEKEVIAEKPVKNGERVQLTIDVNIQEKIYNAYENKAGTSSAIDPKTGEILALISSPAFDPNEFTYGISDNRWNQLMDNPSKPLINRFASTYAPGSSIKPITAAVGIANGTINFKDGVNINGLKWGKKEWGNVKVTRVSTSANPVTLKDALKRSDNIYFAMKAVDMGSKKYIDGMNAFGFGEKIPLQFPIQHSQISNSGKLDEILLANTSYGQGETEVSSLHIALAYTVFLNKGNMLKPSLLLDDKHGEIWHKDLLTENEANKMKEYLRAVVAEGTAKSANDEDLPIAGKTGTAELKLTKEAGGHENGWFIGYPVKDEDILIAMMMENVEHSGSSSYVAGKVKDVLKEIKK